MSVEQRIRRAGAIAAPPVRQRVTEHVLGSVGGDRHTRPDRPQRRSVGREGQPFQSRVHALGHGNDARLGAGGTEALEDDRAATLRELLGERDTRLGDPFECLRSPGHGGELLRHELDWLIGGLLLSHQSHARHEAAQLFGRAVRGAWRRVGRRQQHPRAPRKISDGYVRTRRIACHVGAPVDGRELYQRGPALAGRRI